MDSQSRYKKRDNEKEVIRVDVLVSEIGKMIRRYWWLILSICISCAVLGIFWSMVTYVPYYESKVSFSVVIQSKLNESDATYSFDFNNSSSDQLGNAILGILKNEILEEFICRELKIESVESNVILETFGESNLFTLKVKSTAQENALRIVEAIMKYLPDVLRYVVGESKFNIVSSAQFPQSASNILNWKMSAIGGCYIGLVLCSIVILCYVMSRKVIRTEDDFKENLDIKCLGVIPFQKNNKRKTIIFNENINYYIAEAFRSCSRKIEREMNLDKSQVLLITSVRSEEGKSIISENIAAVWEKCGRKILLLTVGASAKNREVSQGKIENNWQLTDIYTEAFQKMLSEAKQNYDYIIIDSLACQEAADVAVIAQLADKVLFVVAEGAETYEEFMEAVYGLAVPREAILGGMLNKVKYSVIHQEYGYYGSYRYGR